MNKQILLKSTVALLFILLCSEWGFAQQPIKVACIGNSITYGSTLSDRVKDSYPTVLAKMLGAGYEVRNYGNPGRTLLRKGDYPYWNEPTLVCAKSFMPNIVVVKLGTNDSKARNWRFKGDFKSQLVELIDQFAQLSSKPKIYLCLPVPTFMGSKTKSINDSIIVNGVIPIIQEVAKQRHLSVIDLYQPFREMKNLFPDRIHPNIVGAAKMAGVISKALTGKDALYEIPEYAGNESKWHGFKRFDFLFYPNYSGYKRSEKIGHFQEDYKGIPARIAVPKKALPGKPWVWRARFPDWHFEMDSILLSEGYHVAYINTDNQFGSPRALDIWDTYYSYLVEQHGLSPKVSLEGVSRGGLFIYGWAKRNPEKVNCIYAEAPVCNFTSWPGGFGKGLGSAGDWKRLKSEYGFNSDDQAKAWGNNPMDSLENLAKAKVPIFHMIGLNDHVVPPAENTMLLVQRYLSLGGPATVIPCTLGKQALKGHHFTIETPRLGAEFIKYNTYVPAQPLESKSYHKLRSGIRNSLIKFQRNKKGRVAFLGGSITYNGGWRDSICNYLTHRFPDTDFEFIAAGIPSMGTTPAAFRLVRDVLSQGHVDLLFEEAAVNDSSNGRSAKEQRRAMEGIVRHLRENDPTTDIVMMHFVDPQKMASYRTGKIPEVIQNHELVADNYEITSINLAKEVTDRIDSGEFTWKDDFKNLHPSPFGQHIYYHSMKELLDNAWSGFVAEDDKITSYTMAHPIDKDNYGRGVLVEINHAKLGTGWSIIDHWKPADGTGTRANYVDVPMLVGKSSKGIIKFQFEGTAVGIAVAAGKDAGIIEYSIDKGPWSKQDLFTKWSRHLHLPWYYTLSTGLVDKKHTLRIRISEHKNSQSIGTACRIRYFYVNK